MATTKTTHERVLETIAYIRRTDRDFITPDTLQAYTACTVEEARAGIVEVFGQEWLDAQDASLAIRGLPASIYKNEGRDFSNGGISSTADEVTIVGYAHDPQKVERLPITSRVFEPSDKAPPVVIVIRQLFGQRIAQAQPAAIGPDGAVTLLRKAGAVGPMMGGCYVGSSDARLRELTGSFDPIALHDRFETTAQYASHD
jgi:hypothetical protein